MNFAKKIGNCFNLIFSFTCLNIFVLDDVVKELGYGGQGITYLVKDYSRKKFVIKTILLNSPKSALNEISVLFNRNLQSDHLVRYYEHFSKGEFENIVMEYCENGDLEKYIEKHKVFSENVFNLI
jgi:serine/threonine protein kinase